MLARYIGRKRIDIPVVNTSTAMAAGDAAAVVPVARIRFNCIRALEVSHVKGERGTPPWWSSPIQALGALPDRSPFFFHP